MITVEKTCYNCGSVIQPIKSDYEKFNEKFVIDTVIVECIHGHKNTVKVQEDNGLD